MLDKRLFCNTRVRTSCGGGEGSGFFFVFFITPDTSFIVRRVALQSCYAKKMLHKTSCGEGGGLRYSGGVAQVGVVALHLFFTQKKLHENA